MSHLIYISATQSTHFATVSRVHSHFYNTLDTMRSSLLTVAAAVAVVNAQGAQPAPSPTVVAAPGTLPLGADCSNTEQCAGGAQCYASNFMQTTQCGKYNAECQNDSQCATNFCAGGLCSGPLPQSEWLMPSSLQYLPASTATSSVIASSTSSAGGIQPAPSSTVVAAAGSLPLGAECANTEQCAGGAECFASTAWLIKSCGKFNAACSNDSQCATNTCNNGLCNGFLASSLWLQPTSIASTATSTAISTAASATGTLPIGAECASNEQCVGGARCSASAMWLVKSCVPATTASSTATDMMSIMPISTSTSALVPLGKSCNATSQCANGAECTVSSAYQEAAAGMVCGPFNATCTDSSQCSYNSCFDGRCIGLVGYEYATSTATVSGKPTLIAVNGSSAGTATATRTPSSTVAAYTGGAARAGVEGVVAAVFGAVAFLL